MDKPELSSKKRSMAAIVAAGVLFLSCAGWAAIQAASHNGAAAAADPLAEDTLRLWKWLDHAYAGGAGAAEWTVRWDVPEPSDEGMTLEKLTQLLSGNKGRDSDKLYAGAGDYVTVPVMDGSAELDIYDLAGHSKAGNEAHGYLILLRIRSGAADKKALTGYETQIAAKLKEGDMTYEGSVSARGTTTGKQAAAEAARNAGAREVERYEDGGTVSIAYYTSQLHSQLEVGGGQTANLQLAVHQRTDTGEWELTAGSPLITGDYSIAE